MSKAKIILHIDLNAFFVKCEEIKNPALIGKPTIIGHEGRGGIVSTCSYEARKYGVHSGMPTFQAKKLCPNLIVIPGHYDLYEEMSDKFFNFVRRYFSLYEKASIDECFIDATKELSKVEDVVSYLREFQETLTKETGLTVSIGVSPTRFLSKMASDMEKPNGLVILRRRDFKEKIYPLPIESFFGIGRKTSPELRKMGINTIGDLANFINNKEDESSRFFGKFYYVLKEWVNGYGNDEIDVKPWDPKSIGNSRTLRKDTASLEEIVPMLKKLAKEVSDRAIEADKIGNSVQLTLKDAEYVSGFKSITRSKHLDKYTNDYNIIYNTAYTLLENNLGENPIRLVGVSLNNLIDKGEELVQLSIFDNFEQIEEENSTKLLVHELNRKMKKDVFKTLREKKRDDKYGNK